VQCLNWGVTVIIIILSFKEPALVKVSWQKQENFVVVVVEFMMALVAST
jgi:hypothetical protein